MSSCAFLIEAALTKESELIALLPALVNVVKLSPPGSVQINEVQVKKLLGFMKLNQPEKVRWAACAALSVVAPYLQHETLEHQLSSISDALLNCSKGSASIRTRAVSARTWAAVLTTATAWSDIRRDAISLLSKWTALILKNLSDSDTSVDVQTQIHFLVALESSLRTVASAFRPHVETIESLLLKILANDNIAVTQHVVSVLALLPSSVSNSGEHWSQLTTRITSVAAALHTFSRPVGLNQSSVQDPSSALGWTPIPELGVESTTVATRSLIISTRINNLIKALQQLLQQPLQTVAEIPLDQLLSFIGNVLGEEISDMKKAVGSHAHESVVTSTRSCCLDLLLTVINRVGRNILSRASWISSLVLHLLGMRSMVGESVRVRIYAVVSTIFDITGAAFRESLGGPVLRAVVQDIKTTPSADNHSTQTEKAPKRRKIQESSSAVLGDNDVSSTIASHLGSASIAAAFDALRSLVTAVGPLLPVKDRTEAEAGLLCVLMSLSPDHMRTSPELIQPLVALYSSVTAFILAPNASASVSPFLSVLTPLLQQGLAHPSTTVSQSCSQALLALESTLHPAVPTVFRPQILQTISPISILPSRERAPSMSSSALYRNQPIGHGSTVATDGIIQVVRGTPVETHPSAPSRMEIDRSVSSIHISPSASSLSTGSVPELIVRSMNQTIQPTVATVLESARIASSSAAIDSSTHSSARFSMQVDVTTVDHMETDVYPSSSSSSSSLSSSAAVPPSVSVSVSSSSTMTTTTTSASSSSSSLSRQQHGALEDSTTMQHTESDELLVDADPDESDIED